MANWENKEIILENREKTVAQAPVIISASRATDIPAFFAKWFQRRFDIGYVKWTNPFNGKPIYVSFENARLIVFWSKNPKPMIEHLDYFDKKEVNYYFQYTLNDYEIERFEAGVPSKKERIETFKELSSRLGKDRVVWRFDPLLITRDLSPDVLLKRLKILGDELVKYTNKLVFSFADIGSYRKVQNNLREIPYIEFNEDIMLYMGEQIGKMAKEWGIDVGTCSEKIDLNKFGIVHNKCIDNELIARNFSDDVELMDFLGLEIDIFGQITHKKNIKDKGQREDCGCVIAKDIGQYNTCVHKCVYCYANTSKETAFKNYQKYRLNPNCEGILV